MSLASALSARRCAGCRQPVAADGPFVRDEPLSPTGCVYHAACYDARGWVEPESSVAPEVLFRKRKGVRVLAPPTRLYCLWGCKGMRPVEAVSTARGMTYVCTDCGRLLLHMGGRAPIRTRPIPSGACTVVGHIGHLTRRMVTLPEGEYPTLSTTEAVDKEERREDTKLVCHRIVSLVCDTCSGASGGALDEGL